MFDFFKKPSAAPELAKLNLGSVSSMFPEFLGQQEYLPELGAFAGQLNKQYQQSLQGVAPELLASLGQASANTAAQLRGEIPQDVQDQLRRNAAIQQLTGGYGAASGMGRNLVARDFGLTSLDLMQRGQGNLQSVLGMSQALNPNQASQYLFSPSQILQRRDQEATTNLGIEHQNQAIRFANSQRRSPFSSLLSNTLGSIVSAPFNAVSSAANIVGQAPNIALGSYLGGGTGGLFGGALSGLFGQQKQPYYSFGINPLAGAPTSASTNWVDYLSNNQMVA